MSSTTRRFGLILAAAGVLILATATYGFGSLVADRTLDIGTADDDSAYLQYTAQQNITIDRSGPTEAFSLNNTFDEQLYMSVSVVDSPVAIDVSGPSTLESDEPGVYALNCSTTTQGLSSGVVELEISAEGPSRDVTMTRELTDVDIQCGSESGI